MKYSKYVRKNVLSIPSCWFTPASWLGSLSHDTLPCKPGGQSWARAGRIVGPCAGADWKDSMYCCRGGAGSSEGRLHASCRSGLHLTSWRRDKLELRHILVSTILDEILPCLFYQRHQNHGAPVKIVELEALPCQPPDLLILNEWFHADKTNLPPNGHFRNCLSWRSDIFFIVLEN